MMETLIAISVGVVVGGGILTLVYRILVGERAEAKMENALAELAKKPRDAQGTTGTSNANDKA